MCVPVALGWSRGVAKVVDRSVVSAASAGRKSEGMREKEANVRMWLRLLMPEKVHFARICCEVDKGFHLFLVITVTKMMNFKTTSF